MAFFNPSIKTIDDARSEIADAAGASADAEMKTRAGRSLDAAFEHFNNRANWEFCFTEATPISVVAPFQAVLSASSGQTSATVAVNHGVLVDDIVSASGIVVGTRVSATAGTSIGLNQAWVLPAGIQTITASFVRDIYNLPTDWKAVYSVRMYVSQRTLQPVRRRLYDRSITDEFTVSTPELYDLSLFGGRGKIRLLPPPNTSDVLQLRYYRRLSVLTATASALDIPQDYEPYLIGWAKWHFLMDKTEGRSEQASTWLSFATDGIQVMMRNETRIPDENLMFSPGHFAMTVARNPNTPYYDDWQ